MSQSGHPVPYFQSGSPLTDEYLASNTFLNGTQYPYPGMKGAVCQFQIGGPGNWNLGVFQLVKAASGVTPALGDVLYWSDRTIFEVTNVVTGGQLAGISPALMTAAASAFWMVLEGDVPVHILDSPTNTTASGTFAVPSSTTGRADSITSAPTVAQYPLIGRALGAESPTHFAKVRVNIPRI